MTQTTTYHHSRGGHTNQHQGGATITQSPSDSAATVELKTTLHELRQTREEISDEIKSLGPIPRRRKQSSSERQQERGGEEEEEEAMTAPKKRTRENRDSGGSLKEDPERKRSKRMFGNLVLGTLQRSKTDLLKTRDRDATERFTPRSGNESGDEKRRDL